MTCPRPRCWAHKPTIFIPSYWAFLSPTLQTPVNPKMREAADALGKGKKHHCFPGDSYSDCRVWRAHHGCCPWSLGVMDRIMDEELRGKDPRVPQGLRLPIWTVGEWTDIITSDLL